MKIPVDVLNAYFNKDEVKSVSEFGNGHIQSTFKIETPKSDFVLQKINTSVFQQAYILINNHILLQNHLESIEKPDYTIPRLIKTKGDEFYYENQQSGFWRLISYIPNTRSLEKTENPVQAFEAGKAYGWFAKVLQKANISSFEEAIPEFHSISHRLRQFEEALQKDAALRKESVKEEIDFFMQRKEELLKLEQLIVKGKIPKRIVHNDTKINNVLFRGTKAVAVIDLDTVGPGSILFDYGDALRTIANTANEDEEDIKKVKFSFDNYNGFTKGYLSQTASFLSISEKQNLHLSPVLMTYIVGLRFLTDFLNGDIYFKTKKENHNLIRTRVQQKLIMEIEG
ncbi:MAG: aminoglycoside phosphotransferase family protein, partial [Chlorobi bacterium]|nr:aminoglycoside phosphotransferase family protein [Chlorobiota bacterium]